MRVVEEHAYYVNKLLQMLVWKIEFDFKLWRQKERTPNTNDHHKPLNEPSPMKIFCLRHCVKFSNLRKHRARVENFGIRAESEPENVMSATFIPQASLQIAKSTCPASPQNSGAQGSGVHLPS